MLLYVLFPLLRAALAVLFAGPGPELRVSLRSPYVWHERQLGLAWLALCAGAILSTPHDWVAGWGLAVDRAGGLV